MSQVFSYTSNVKESIQPWWETDELFIIELIDRQWCDDQESCIACLHESGQQWLCPSLRWRPWKTQSGRAVVASASAALALPRPDASVALQQVLQQVAGAVEVVHGG